MHIGASHARIGFCIDCHPSTAVLTTDCTVPLHMPLSCKLCRRRRRRRTARRLTTMPRTAAMMMMTSMTPRMAMTRRRHPRPPLRTRPRMRMRRMSCELQRQFWSWFEFGNSCGWLWRQCASRLAARLHAVRCRCGAAAVGWSAVTAMVRCVPCSRLSSA